MTTLQFSFLGPIEICQDDHPLLLPPTLRSQSLLAYLVIHRSQVQPRELLSELFFGERSERKARRSLSTALWHIHRCLPDPAVILSDAQTVQFDPRTPLWLDVAEFETLAAQQDRENLQRAVSLYRGDFLQGFYDDWILSERYRLELLYLEALSRLMTIFETGGDSRAALAAALRLLSRDSLCEDAYRVAMRAYCRMGQRKAALEQYQRCREVLENELGVQPMVQTQALYNAIASGALSVLPPAADLPSSALPSEPGGRHPLDVTTTVRLTGRDSEMRFLEDCWRSAQDGGCRMALVSGEVGVGKTRLVDAFASRLRWQGLRVMWGRCYEFERILPYQPIADALRSGLPELSKTVVAGFPDWALREASRLAPELLDLPCFKDHSLAKYRKSADQTPVQPVLSGEDPAQARLFAGVTRILAEIAAQSPLLVVLEDLHWAGESTLQLVHHLVRSLSGQKVLIAGTFRSEDAGPRHPLHALHTALAKDNLAKLLDLSRLPLKVIETMIEEMSGAGAIVLPLARRLYMETEGNPFFLFEILKALFETGEIQWKENKWQGDFNRISQAAVPIPSSMSEAVQARVRRLSETTQDGLRLAAVLGREFNDELLGAAWGKGEEAALELLDELLRHRLVEEKSEPNDSNISFSHHKIQEIIYQNISLYRRPRLHAQAGTAMEEFYAAELEHRAGELAHHFEQACKTEKTLCDRAITYLMKAGHLAVTQSAHQDALGYYQRGLDIVQTRPKTKQSMRREIELLLAMAIPITTMKGYASRDAMNVYSRIKDICEVLEDAPDLFTSMIGLSRYYGITGELETGLKFSEKTLSIAQKEARTEHLMEAYRQMGGIMLSLGRLRESSNFWERGIALYQPDRHEHHVKRYGHDPIVPCLGYHTINLWMMGCHDQSLLYKQRLASLLPALTNASSQAYGYCLLAILACARQMPEETRNYAEAAFNLSQLHGISSWAFLATALHGWARFELGEVEEGLARLDDGIQAWMKIGFAVLAPFLLAMKAACCLKIHRTKEGMLSLEEAETIGQSREHLWFPEVQRLHGIMLLESGGDSSEAEKHFHRALDTARQQGAGMLELRAGMNLARMWQAKGQVREAQVLLGDIYQHFSEGLDTDELRIARELLLGLSQQFADPSIEYPAG